jgi:hypothetical protein
VALGNHLGPDQDIDLLPHHALDQALVRPLAGGGVAIHSGNAGGGKQRRQLLFQPFGSRPLRLDGATPAGRTKLGRRLDIVAIVAAQLAPPPVEGQGDGAVGTAKGRTAVGAEQKRGKAAAVEQQQRLFPAPEGLCESGSQRRREAIFPFRARLAQVDQFHRGEGSAGDPTGQRQVTQLAAAGPVIGGHRRRGTPQQDDRPGHLPTQQGKVAGMVAEALGLLVARLVFLVDDDDAGRRQRGEERGAGADDDGGLAAGDAAPGIVALAVGESGMQNGDLSPAPGETGTKAAHQLRGQGDLGNQHEGCTPPLQGIFNGPQIDFGLAAAGDAVQEEGREGAGSEGSVNGCQGGRLLGRERHRAIGGDGSGQEWVAMHLDDGLGQNPCATRRCRGACGAANASRSSEREAPPRSRIKVRSSRWREPDGSPVGSAGV